MIFPTGKTPKMSTIKIAQVLAIYESSGQTTIEIKLYDKVQKVKTIYHAKSKWAPFSIDI